MESFFFHPKLVHLPIALAVLMPAIAAGLALAWQRKLLPRRVWWVAVLLQVALVGASMVAMRSGEAEEELVERVVAERHIEAHEEAAAAFLGATVVVLLLAAGGLAVKDERVGLALAGATVVGSLVAFGLGARVGAAGGALVYEHGAAAAYAGSPAAGAGAAVERGGHHEDEEDDD